MSEAPTFEAAFLTIKPLQFSPGPNFWTAESGGEISWGISAPTVRQLVAMLREWFAEGELP